MKEKDLPKKNKIMQNFLDKKASKNDMKTAKNRSGKGIFVIDIDQNMMILSRLSLTWLNTAYYLKSA